MVNQEEIILMTKLALYEKKYGKQDKSRNAYFKWDYIYINNWYTRFAAGVAAFMIISWMVLTDIYLKEIMPVLDITLSHYLKKYTVLFGLIILVYTGVSTLIHNKWYEDTQKRLEKYECIIQELDDYQSLKQARGREVDDTAKPGITDPGPNNLYL